MGWRVSGGMVNGLLPPSESSKVQSVMVVGWWLSDGVFGATFVSSIHSLLPSAPSGLGKISVILII